MNSRRVLKIGGSLLKVAPALVAVVRDSHRSLLIVPGGGPWAEQVRVLDPPREEAHWMAVLAMEQYGWYLASLGLETTEHPEETPGPKVLLPYRLLRRKDPLPHSWDVTSDTIAAWIASEWKAPLTLLKAVDGLYQGDRLLDRVTAPVPCRQVDPAFLPFVFDHHVECIVLNGTVLSRVKRHLEGFPVLSTRIDTTV